MRRRAATACLILSCGACTAAAPVPAATPALSASQAGEATARAGTLRSEQITVELRDGPLLVRITPLDDEVVRLTAPDTRRRLGGLVASQRQVLAGEPVQPDDAALFLVSFQSTEPDRNFEPEALAIETGLQRLRPLRVLPLTPGWGERRLRPLTAEVAVYVFDRPVPPMLPFVIHYGSRSSDGWRNVIPLLQAEQRRRF
jgi:hypothetical protein